ncbi:MAG: hypothetical protein K0S27_192 [Gammaproteobacteria bacterium]|jgi:surfeit locus 1 family protein|nr:hypothetical protein [Gammaproteobacteria bacterium]
MSNTICFNKRLFIFCVFFISLFCLLGVWQLQRYQYKKMILFRYEQSLHTIPISILELSHFLPFQPVLVKGKYLNNRTIFLQNRYYHGQLGIEILTPFQVEGGKKLLLINRGWVKEESNPTIRLSKIKGNQYIKGYIKLLDEPQFILGKNILKQTPTEIILQKIDIKELNKATGQLFYPFILRLDPRAPHGFIRDWIITTVLPQRHMAYAIQWFAMAFILFFASFVLFQQKD